MVRKGSVTAKKSQKNLTFLILKMEDGKRRPGVKKCEKPLEAGKAKTIDSPYSFQEKKKIFANILSVP